jgi:hypothetical protein
VQDFASDLSERRTRHERTFIKGWRRGFPKRQSEEFLVSVGPAKETQRTEVTNALVFAYFNELKDVLPMCVTPN